MTNKPKYTIKQLETLVDEFIKLQKKSDKNMYEHELVTQMALTCFILFLKIKNEK